MGNEGLVLMSASIPEICPVGKELGSSETRYPKVINNDNSIWSYCDLPGFFDSGNESENVCAAVAPEILRRSAKSIKGLVWVINMAQFTVNRADSIKKMLKYFLEISNNNPDLIVDSLCIVGTHAREGAKSEGIRQGLKNIIKCIDNPDEKALLQKIIDSQSVKIAISNVVDTTGENRKLINSIVDELKPPPAPLNFKEYSEYEKKFNQYLIDSAEFYHEKVNMINDCQTNLSSTRKEITEAHDKYAQLEKQLSDEEHELRENIKKQSELKLLRDNQQQNIGAIEQHKIKKLLTFQEPPEMIQKPPSKVYGEMDYNSNPVMINRGNYIAAIAQRGNQPYESGGIIYEIFPPEPKPGKANKKLVFEANYPVSVKSRKLNKEEKILTGTERTNKGYEVDIQYDIGKGYDISVKIEIEKKNTPTGKKSLQEARILLENADNEILTIKQRNTELRTNIHDNQDKQKQIKTQVSQLESKKDKYLNEIKDTKELLKVKHEFFASVNKISKTFELDKTDKTLENFTTIFEKNNNEMPQNWHTGVLSSALNCTLYGRKSAAAIPQPTQTQELETNTISPSPAMN
jgi:predicted nuclease with TOPRIM domain